LLVYLLFGLDVMLRHIWEFQFSWRSFVLAAAFFHVTNQVAQNWSWFAAAHHLIIGAQLQPSQLRLLDQPHPHRHPLLPLHPPRLNQPL